MPSLHSPKLKCSLSMTKSRPGNCCRSSAAAQGYEVATANDGRAAIAASTRSPEQFRASSSPTCNLPGADGFEVLKAARARQSVGLRRDDHRLRELDSAVRAVREGAYDYLAKPFSLGQLDVMLAASRTAWRSSRRTASCSRRVVGHDGQAASGDLALAAAGDRGRASRTSKPCSKRARNDSRNSRRRNSQPTPNSRLPTSANSDGRLARWELGIGSRLESRVGSWRVRVRDAVLPVARVGSPSTLPSNQQRIRALRETRAGQSSCSVGNRQFRRLLESRSTDADARTTCSEQRHQ